MLEFRDITIEDKLRVDACTRAYSYHLCEHCFTDLFIWRGHYKTQICFWKDFLLVQMQTMEDATVMYLAPIGEGDLAEAISMLEQDAAERHVPFIMCSIAEEMKPRVEAAMPDSFVYDTDDSGWDYIYLSEKLQTLSGKSCNRSAIWSTVFWRHMRDIGATRILLRKIFTMHSIFIWNGVKKTAACVTGNFGVKPVPSAQR